MRCEYISKRDEGIVVKCPTCEKSSLITDTYSLKHVDGATFECSNCSEMLVGLEHAGVYVAVPLHKWINRSNNDWPSDGAGTKFIEIPYSDDYSYPYEV